MRPTISIGGLSHSALTVGVNDHHNRPKRVTVSNTTQMIAAGSAFNLDITLGVSGFVFARVQLMGPKTSGGSWWRECAEVHVTATLNDALGHSFRDTGSNNMVYAVTYAKAVGTTNLTHKIFDTATAIGSRYIALKDAQIVGSDLRLTFHNYNTSTRTLWVKGGGLVW